MKKIKSWWKRMDYWKKGGIIGFLIPVVFFLTGSLLSYMLHSINYSLSLSIIDIFDIPVRLLTRILDNLIETGIIKCMSETCGLGGYHMLIALLSPLIYAFIGIVIGTFIEKYKKRKNEQE